MKFTKIIHLLSALIIGLGIFGAGFCIGKSIYFSKLFNRSVTVKGLAERDVKADLGIWEINYREIGSNLGNLSKAILHDQGLVIAFLKQNGFTDQELEPQPVRVDDRIANNYSQTPNSSLTNDRFVITGGLRVRSSRVDLIRQVTPLTNALLEQGVQLAFDVSGISPNPSYYFTQLDAIRPAMIAEATRSARLVGEQFAKDSGSKLGSIQHASQGIFQIMGRDSSLAGADTGGIESLGAINKKIRLVTTIDYQLR